MICSHKRVIQMKITVHNESGLETAVETKTPVSVARF